MSLNTTFQTFTHGFHCTPVKSSLQAIKMTKTVYVYILEYWHDDLFSKVMGQGRFMNYSECGKLCSDIEDEIEERGTGMPSGNDGLNQLLTSSASLLTWVW